MYNKTVYYYDSHRNKITEKWYYNDDVHKIYSLDNTFASIKNSFFAISNDNVLTL